MLGITASKEDKGKTEAWISELGVQYPYAYFGDGKLSEATGHKGYPHAALVDPKGTIVWAGHPSSLSNGTVESALKGASKYISYGWPKEFQKVAKAVNEGDFGAAIAEATKLAAAGTERGEEVKAAVVGMLDVCIADMNAAMEGGDFYAANEIAERLSGKLKGLDQDQAVAAVLERLKKDKDVKTILKGQTALQKVMQGELRKDKQVEAAMAKAEKIAKKYPGTIVERQAKDFVQKMKLRLRGR